MKLKHRILCAFRNHDWSKATRFFYNAPWFLHDSLQKQTHVIPNLASLLTISSFRPKNHVFRLQALANVVHTRFEARQLWKDGVSVSHLESRYFVPSFILSCITSRTVITSTSFPHHQGLNPSRNSSFATVKFSWMQSNSNFHCCLWCSSSTHQFPYFYQLSWDTQPH